MTAIPTPESTGTLIAVGGLSGSGKSTLAWRLMRDFGAVYLRADAIRKELWSIPEKAKLPEEAYTPKFNAITYAEMECRAVGCLRAGRTVIVDMVFARPEERTACAAYAAAAGAAFHGIWLDAAPDALRHRVDARRGDVSDATSKTVAMQLGFDLGHINWTRINANFPADSVYGLAHGILLVGGVRADDSHRAPDRRHSPAPKL